MTKLAYLPALLAFTAGCPLAPACGGFTGGADKVYHRGATDVLIECENGGYLATLTTGKLEGKLAEGVAIDPTTAGVRFTQVENADGTMSTPELPGDAWTQNQLSQVDLDHVDNMCVDLEARAWWPAPLDRVSDVTEYIDGGAPTTKSTYRLILCPSGSLYVHDWYGEYTATYSVTGGQVHFGNNNAGTIYADGYFDHLADPEPGFARYWDKTSSEADAAARFCSTGTFAP